MKLIISNLSWDFNDNYKVISNDEVIHYGVPTEYTKKPSDL